MTILLFAAILAAGPVEFWTSPELKSAAGAVAGDADSKGIAGKTLGGASLWRRSKTGQAEMHKNKTDLFVIEEGSATLLYGGTLRDAHSTQPNEVRGTAVEGGESKKVGPGDIVRIPPNTPHQFVLEKGQSVAYFSLKLAP
jgi:mannose-6-phosphate isomerase-like protein (cupin superfamily)